MKLPSAWLLLIVGFCAPVRAEECSAAAALAASVDGQSMQEWLDAGRTGEAAQRDRALAALHRAPALAIAAAASQEQRVFFDEFGLADRAPEAVPALTDLLSCESMTVRGNAVRFLGWIGAPAVSAVPALLERLRDPAWLVRVEAALSLGRIGIFSEDELSQLAAGLGNWPPVAYACAAALRNSGPRAIPLMVTALADPRPLVPLLAANVLAGTGRPVPEALPALLDILRDGPVQQRIEALHVLRNLDSGDIGSAAPTILPLLADPALRCEAARALALHGDAGARRAALPVMLDAVASADEADRCASDAVSDLAALGAAAVPGLERVLAHASPTAGRRAVLALGAIDPPTRSSLAALGRALSDRELAANAGDQLSRLGALAVPFLARALDADEPAARREASWALARLGPRGADALPAMLRQLPVETGDTKRALIVALGRVGGTRAHGAAPELRRALDDPTARTEAAGALARIERADAADVVPILVAALRQQVRGMCPHPTANEELEAIGAPAVPALVELLRDPEFPAYWILPIFDRRGSKGLEALRPLLVEWLGSGLPAQRLDSAGRLARMSLDEPARDRVASTLGEFLASENPWVRLQAAEGLVRMGHAEDPEVARALLELQDHRFEEVRTRARAALAEGSAGQAAGR